MSGKSLKLKSDLTESTYQEWVDELTLVLEDHPIEEQLLVIGNILAKTAYTYGGNRRLEVRDAIQICYMIAKLSADSIIENHARLEAERETSH